MKRRIVSCDFAPITCERAPTTAYRGPFLFSARSTAIRVIIVGPPSPTTSISASIAACHSGTERLRQVRRIVPMPSWDRERPAWRFLKAAAPRLAGLECRNNAEALVKAVTSRGRVFFSDVPVAALLLIPVDCICRVVGRQRLIGFTSVIVDSAQRKRPSHSRNLQSDEAPARCADTTRFDGSRREEVLTRPVDEADDGENPPAPDFIATEARFNEEELGRNLQCGNKKPPRRAACLVRRPA
jgi:hypothetical protein